MIYDKETARYCIAAILRHPQIVADVAPYVKEHDFGDSDKLHRTIYSCILDSSKKQQEVSPLTIAKKIKNLGISFKEIEGGDIGDYLDEISLIQITEKAGIEFFKNLKKIAIRREFWEIGQKLQGEMKDIKDSSIDDIINRAYKICGGGFEKIDRFGDEEFYNIYENLEAAVMERASNPLDEFGPMSPFKRVNEVFGSLLRPGNIMLVAARTGMGKSSISSYVMTHICDKYKYPILHLDCGEMTAWELQCRAVNMLSNGKVPYDLVENGKWIYNPELKLIVPPLLKKVQHLNYNYRAVGGMTDDEKLSVIRRFHMAKVGHGNYFAVNDDYPKSFDDGKQAEWLQLDFSLRKIKNLIKDEIKTCGYWAAAQRNKQGITGNKSVSQIDDTEATLAGTDRISNSLSHGAIMRWKTPQEQADEPGMGNMILKFFKARHLGSDPGAYRNLIEMPDGSFQPNRFLLKSTGFSFEEVGDLVSLNERFGNLLPPDKDPDDDIHL